MVKKTAKGIALFLAIIMLFSSAMVVNAESTLSIGSRGEEVRQLQNYLNQLGANPRLDEDGIFRNGTYNAVVAFQRSKGLTADGIVGPNTWAAIRNAMNERLSNSLTYAVTLTKSNPTALVNINPGKATSVTVSGGAATVYSHGGSGDPALYNASGTMVADDEAGHPHWRYRFSSGQTLYAGFYGSGAPAGSYYVTATFDNTSAPAFGNLSISAPTSYSMSAGQSGTINVTFSGQGIDSVDTSVSGSGLSASVSNISWRAYPGSCTATINVSASNSSTGGTVTFQLKNNSSGVIKDHSIRINVTAPPSSSITLTPSNPTALVNINSGKATPVTVSGGAATVYSHGGSGDPALYNASGTMVADDEAGHPHWRYTFSSGQTFYAGFYGSGAPAGSYYVTATFNNTPSTGVTLTPSNPTALVNISSGSRVAVTVSGGRATVVSNGNNSCDPALYSAASGGTRVADDEAGNYHWRYTFSSGQTFYAGTYGNGSGSYYVTATF